MEHRFPIQGQGTVFFDNSNTNNELRFELYSVTQTPILEVIFTEQMIQVNPIFLGKLWEPCYDEENQCGLIIDQEGRNPIYWFSFDTSNRMIYVGIGMEPRKDNVIYKYKLEKQREDQVDNTWIQDIGQISWCKDKSKVSYMKILRIDQEPFSENEEDQDEDQDQDQDQETNQKQFHNFFSMKRFRRRKQSNHFISSRIEHIISTEYDKQRSYEKMV